MEVVVSNEGAVTVLKPLGPIIAGDLEEMEKELLAFYKNWTQRIVINLKEVTFIDSAGLELLNRFRHQLSEHGLKLKLCAINEITRKIFDLTKQSRNYEIYTDTTSAVRSFL